MEQDLDGGGFRSLFEKAIRTDDDANWTEHMIRYDNFKKRLKVFAQRRKQVRTLLKQSPDGRVAEQITNEILTSTKQDSLYQKRQMVMTSDEGDGLFYLPLGEFEIPSGSSDMSSQSSAGSAKKRRTKRSIMRRMSNAERNEITVFLSTELQRAFRFYNQRWQQLSDQLQELRRSGRQVEPTIGDEILELIAFCVTNIVSAHQILIRYDAFARAFEGTPMRTYYMKKARKKPTPFRKLLKHYELEALADTFTQGNESNALVVQFCSQRFMFHDIIGSLDHKSGIVVPEVACKWPSLVSFWKLTMIGLFEDRLGLEPAFLTERGKSLTEQMEQLAIWRKKKHEIIQPRTRKKLTGLQRYHLTLNLLSAFLYCMNYYIVEPSSTMYANRLGAPDGMSGALIGMMPLAGFVSAVPYSMWTNHSFRQAFLMSSSLMMLGNLIYGMAAIFGSFPMVLTGRFISGLGAPKVLIRRYMADTTPVSLRTSVNAGFGMVVAAGSAMGPFMAVFLASYELTIEIPYFSYVTLNGLTLPGYLMSALWFTFTVILLITFEEPERAGLKEQQEIEQSSAIKRSASAADRLLAEAVDPDDEFKPDLDDPDLLSLFSAESHDYPGDFELLPPKSSTLRKMVHELRNVGELITLPVQLCLGLLLAKVFTIETLVSSTSSLSKNRYRWQVHEVGTLGFSNGLLVIPFSILVGRMSLSHHDHVLMRWLVLGGCIGFFLLIDLTDLVDTPTNDYNKGHPLAVAPPRYIAGYFVTYLSIQAFEGVIGSCLSKVIPTALASGTFNSALLATLIDTFGRSCGDLSIMAIGLINLRQLMNLLFIPGFAIMFTCLVIIERYRDMLSV